MLHDLLAAFSAEKCSVYPSHATIHSPRKRCLVIVFISKNNLKLIIFLITFYLLLLLSEKFRGREQDPVSKEKVSVSEYVALVAIVVIVVKENNSPLTTIQILILS